jgi:DUF971 family protein
MSQREPGPTSQPVEVEAPRGAGTLTITWSDGARIGYRHALLRGFCPCATCQGHQGPVRWAAEATDDDQPLLELEEVGNYALRLVWADGHATGIYSFDFLRRLASEALTAEAQGLAAVRGRAVPR